MYIIAYNKAIGPIIGEVEGSINAGTIKIKNPMYIGVSLEDTGRCYWLAPISNKALGERIEIPIGQDIIILEDSAPIVQDYISYFQKSN